MQKIVIAGAVVIIILVGAHFFIPKSQTPNSNIPKDTTIVPSRTTLSTAFVYGPYIGTLPCADCEGLQTEITLTKKGEYTDEGTYVVSQTYLGKSEKPLITKGNWTMIRGDAQNPNASVFLLNPDDPGLSVYYLKVGDTEIEMLDNDLKKINSPFDMTLKKKR